MLSLVSVLVLGFLLGMRHATDPDHVVAVTTIVSRQPALRRASLIGALWGVGHTATILIVGGAIILFRIVIPPRLGLAMELAVALMLILLGALNLTGRSLSALQSAMRPLFVGFVHGLAGSAAIALLVLTTIPATKWAIAYLLIFGFGTIAGMMTITMIIALPAALTSARFGSVQRYLRLASGVASIAFGLFLVHQVGFVDGLFTANPVWSPK